MQLIFHENEKKNTFNIKYCDVAMFSVTFWRDMYTIT